MSWLGWLLCTFSNEACLNTQLKQWLYNRAINASQRSTNKQKLNAFLRIEKDLITKGIYQPLYHVQQDLSVSETISTPDGWIDFNRVTMI